MTLRVAGRWLLMAVRRTVYSPEEPFVSDSAPGNTTLRLADSVNVFETGALAPGVTVQRVDSRLLSFDAAMHRLNVQVNRVNRSPLSSTFGTTSAARRARPCRDHD